MEKIKFAENSTQDKTKNLEAKLKKSGKMYYYDCYQYAVEQMGRFQRSWFAGRAHDTFVDVLNKYMIETVQVIEQNRQGSKTPASIKLMSSNGIEWEISIGSQGGLHTLKANGESLITKYVTPPSTEAFMLAAGWIHNAIMHGKSEITHLEEEHGKAYADKVRKHLAKIHNSMLEGRKLPTPDLAHYELIDLDNLT